MFESVKYTGMDLQPGHKLSTGLQILLFKKIATIMLHRCSSIIPCLVIARMNLRANSRCG